VRLASLNIWMNQLFRSLNGAPLKLNQNPEWFLQADFNREYSSFPLTVECWVRLFTKDRKNMILANGYKTAVGYAILANHWAIFTEKETGNLTIHLQNMEPSDINTERPIVDGKWHFIRLVYEIDCVHLYLSGEKLFTQTLKPRIPSHPLSEWSNEGPLYFGSYPPDGLGCDGEIREVRISHQALRSEEVPQAPLTAEPSTVGLWQLTDDPQDHLFPDLSKTGSPARRVAYLPTLDENDRRAFGVRYSPFDREMQPVAFTQTGAQAPAAGKAGMGIEEILLHGRWDCLQSAPHGLSEQLAMQDETVWQDAFPATIPCSIQTALLENGFIEDPMTGMNNMNISWVSEREWWLRKKFTLPDGWDGKRVELRFEGVDYRATFWLNGYRLGQHEGMFGGPDFDVTPLLFTGGRENVLIVCLDPAPINYEDTFKNNVAYGWHYVKLITLGIWRPVRLIQRGETALQFPFLHTTSLNDGAAQVELSIDCWHWGRAPQDVDLSVTLTPKNFSGDGYHFKKKIHVSPGKNTFGFQGALHGAQVWWPVDLGDPNLYWFECTLEKDGQVIDRYRAHWGARLIEFMPTADGPNPHRYNFQMVVNHHPVWVKGTNWCYVESLLRLDAKRNLRFIEIAKNTHIQLLRVWGGGPVENDEFYDACDEMGMMVQQEFSMLGFHRLQNVPSYQATDMTHYMVHRLRNRPSLVIWAGANEISGQGRIVEVLGRRCLELDGTRPFRRSCPYGGDTHWYGVYWGGQPLLDYRKVADGRIDSWSPEMGSNQGKGPTAFTEFGLSSPPNFESWKRLIPEEEWETWPPDRNSVFMHHTPTWEYVHVTLMNQYAGEFLNPSNLKSLIYGMQLSQGLGLKLLIESMRARKPHTTATYFYKLTENYPACSWATIDYFGVPKRSQYDIQQAYQPIHAMAIFDAWNSENGALPVTIYAVNDSRQPVTADLRIQLFDGQFNALNDETTALTLPLDSAVQVREANFAIPDAAERPLFLLLTLQNEDGLIDRSWYYFDFVQQQGSLFTRPKTTLTAELAQENSVRAVTITNTGEVPALSVELHFGDASNTYYAASSGLWLEPGERVTIPIYETEAVDGETRPLAQITCSAWNAQPVNVDDRQ
jgi:beta-mannosidase